jgi:hypothetical protein
MKLPHRRQFLHLAAGAAALPGVSRIARAQAYPTRPVLLGPPCLPKMIRRSSSSVISPLTMPVHVALTAAKQGCEVGRLIDEQRKAGALAKGGQPHQRAYRGKNAPVTPSLLDAGVDNRGREPRRRHRLRWRARVKQSFMSSVPRHRARKGTPKPDRRRALEVLARSPTGCTEACCLHMASPSRCWSSWVHAGLASATAERVRAGKLTMEIARVRITEAGRQILGGTYMRDTSAGAGKDDPYTAPRVNISIKGMAFAMCFTQQSGPYYQVRTRSRFTYSANRQKKCSSIF